MDSEELLAQLADIHLPQAVSYWPPAPGWWVLAIVLLAAVVYLYRRYQAYSAKQKVCQHALAELDRCLEYYYSSSNPGTADAKRLHYVNQFNSVLRRVALVHFAEANVASLGGKEWVDFIREKGDSSLLTDEIAAALSYGRFQTSCDVDVDALNSLGQAWISSLYLGNNQASAEPQGQTT